MVYIVVEHQAITLEKYIKNNIVRNIERNIVRNTWRRSAYRVGPWKVIASHHLHVGLLDEGDPQLAPVAGVGAEQLPVTVHRQEVIDDHLTGNTSYQVPGRTG